MQPLFTDNTEYIYLQNILINNEKHTHYWTTEEKYKYSPKYE